MQRFWINVILSVLGCVGCANAQDVQPQAALNQQSTVDQVLDALEHRGHDLKALRADVKLTETDTALGDSIVRSGSFALQNGADGSTRAHIVFDRKIVDGRTSSEKIEYALEGGKLIDRNYNRKIQSTRQVLRPGEK